MKIKPKTKIMKAMETIIMERKYPANKNSYLMKTLILKSKKGLVKVTNENGKLTYELPTGFFGIDLIRFKKVNKEKIEELKNAKQ